MTQVKAKRICVLVAVFLFLGVAGCVNQCTLIRSEYYDVTGKVFAPKPETQDVPVLAKVPDRSYTEIGVVKVDAPWGTTDAAIDAEMKGRAGRAGADALVGVVREENKGNDVVFCGKVFNTKKSVTAHGTAIVYADKGPDA